MKPIARDHAQLQRVPHDAQERRVVEQGDVDVEGQGEVAQLDLVRLDDGDPPGDVLGGDGAAGGVHRVHERGGLGVVHGHQGRVHGVPGGDHLFIVLARLVVFLVIGRGLLTQCAEGLGRPVLHQGGLVGEPLAGLLYLGDHLALAPGKALHRHRPQRIYDEQQQKEHDDQYGDDQDRVAEEFLAVQRLALCVGHILTHLT